MTHPMTNLNALRAFEATARKCSFTLAAQELCVTQAAVSHQVRQVEEALGVRLFERAHRRVVLTDAGTRVFATISRAFGDIDSVLREVRAEGENKSILTVQVTPSFGSRWLARRLHSFWAEYPEIDLRIYHALPHEQYDVRRVDLAVKWGSGNWAPLRSEALFECQLLPVCAPGYPLDEVLGAAISIPCRIDHDFTSSAWDQWSAVTGRRVSGTTDLSFPHTNLCIEAAITGLGVALVERRLIGAELADGRLRAPCGFAPFRQSLVAIPSGERYQTPSARLFIDWLGAALTNG